MTQDEYAEIDLAALSDDELVEQMHNDLYDGMKDEIVEGTNILLGRGFSATRVLDDALVAGMKIVGIDFRDGILFVPEVLLAANAMKAGMAILRPLLAETGAEPVGKVVIGTVKGDIHDIGKNLVGMMLEGAGFEVFDLGINTDADKFIAALEQHQPDILGHVRAADDDHAVHEGRHPDAQGPRHPRRLHRARRWRAAQRGVRAWPSVPMPTAATPAWPRRRPVASSTNAVPASPATTTAAEDARRPIVGCGALARELLDADPGPAQRRRPVPAGHAPQPAGRHRRRRRDRIAGARRYGYDRVFVAYADCGTGGLLDCAARDARASSACRRPLLRVLRRVARTFAALQAEELGTFYLTDFLARNFDAWSSTPGSGSTAIRSCCPAYFGNYRRLVYLAQTDDPALVTAARRGAPTGSACGSSIAGTGLRRAGDLDRGGDLAGRPGPRRVRHRDGPLTMGVMTVIWWRDIPAQVLAREGRRQSKQVLHPRFQVAIDKAAARAGKSAYNDYIEEWRREQQRLRRRHRGRRRRRDRAARDRVHQAPARRAHPVRRRRGRTGAAARPRDADPAPR